MAETYKRVIQIFNEIKQQHRQRLRGRRAYFHDLTKQGGTNDRSAKPLVQSTS